MTTEIDFRSIVSLPGIVEFHMVREANPNFGGVRPRRVPSIGSQGPQALESEYRSDTGQVLTIIRQTQQLSGPYGLLHGPFSQKF